MYFATRDGTFASTFTLDKNVTEMTEIYLNKSLWYPDGFKIVASANGKALDAGFVTENDSNYVKVCLCELLEQHHNDDINILLTPANHLCCTVA